MSLAKLLHHAFVRQVWHSDHGNAKSGSCGVCNDALVIHNPAFSEAPARCAQGPLMAFGGPDSWHDSSIQYAWDLAHLYHASEKKFPHKATRRRLRLRYQVLTAGQGSDWVSAELEIAVCPQKDLAEYESNFRYSSRTIPAVRCLKPYCGDRPPGDRCWHKTTIVAAYSSVRGEKRKK